jgi:hypothetical protein
MRAGSVVLTLTAHQNLFIELKNFPVSRPHPKDWDLIGLGWGLDTGIL